MYFKYHSPVLIDLLVLYFLKFIEDMSCIRSIHEHSEQCTILEQEGLSSADRQHFSTVYGVNRHALLDNLTYFDVASGALIPDIMHDILEGMLPSELKCMLKVGFL